MCAKTVLWYMFKHIPGAHALEMASKYGKCSVVEWLVQQGVDVKSGVGSAVRECCLRIGFKHMSI